MVEIRIRNSKNAYVPLTPVKVPRGVEDPLSEEFSINYYVVCELGPPLLMKTPIEVPDHHVNKIIAVMIHPSFDEGIIKDDIIDWSVDMTHSF